MFQQNMFIAFPIVSAFINVPTKDVHNIPVVLKYSYVDHTLADQIC